MFDGLDALLTNQDLVHHFRAIAGNLTPGGLYVIECTHPRDCSMHEYGEFRYGGSRDGVDVRILVPGASDLQVVLNASRAEYQDLLDAGVRIYERDDAMVHAKTAVVDGFWSTVGSANYDTMSFLHNDEVNAIVVSREFGREMEALFRRAIAEYGSVTSISQVAANQRA